MSAETEIPPPPIPFNELNEGDYLTLWEKSVLLERYRQTVEGIENLERISPMLFGGGAGAAALPIPGHGQGRFATGAAPTVPQLVHDKLIERGPMSAKELSGLIGKPTASIQNAFSTHKELFEKAGPGKWRAIGE